MKKRVVDPSFLPVSIASSLFLFNFIPDLSLITLIKIDNTVASYVYSECILSLKMRCTSRLRLSIAIKPIKIIIKPPNFFVVSDNDFLRSQTSSFLKKLPSVSILRNFSNQRPNKLCLNLFSRSLYLSIPLSCSMRFLISLQYDLGFQRCYLFGKSQTNFFKHVIGEKSCGREQRQKIEVKYGSAHSALVK